LKERREKEKRRGEEGEGSTFLLSLGVEGGPPQEPGTPPVIVEGLQG